jgi:hypothetical protein
VLYTRGTATVSWNGVQIPVKDGSYAYVGGESVRMQPDAMGVLRLPDGSGVVLCPGASASLSRDSTGGYELVVDQGSARFTFASKARFSVLANGTVVEPAPGREPDGGPVEGEVSARSDGGCLVCELESRIRIAIAGGAATVPPQEQPGRVVMVTPGAAGAPPQISSTPIPAALLGQLRTASQDEPAAFLCRCEELIRDPQREARQEPLPGPGSRVDPAADPERLLPPVAPPDAPPLALAEPGPPNPFDPNVLPPPAAGEPLSPVVTVAPPAVPFTGTGGSGGVTAPPPPPPPGSVPVSGSGGGPVGSPS